MEANYKGSILVDQNSLAAASIVADTDLRSEQVESFSKKGSISLGQPKRMTASMVNVNLPPLAGPILEADESGSDHSGQIEE